MEKSTANKDYLKTLASVFVSVTCVKVLLIPVYHSTDFEVHRNWLAITHSLPVQEWYTNEQSQWTLDYPPFFAWFEYILSQFAVFFDSEMLKVNNLNYLSEKTKIFQRSTVIVLDCLFAFSIHRIGKQFCKNYNTYVTFAILTLANASLLVVDHIHFQYNGFLLSILLLSIGNVCSVNKDKTLSEKHVLVGSLLFAVLLNLKHIYLYVAPVYLVWLLKWCSQKNFVSRFFKLGCIAVIVFIASFGPFITQLPQVISRLFPFKRGLVHAYWAPNAWALYVSFDKVLATVLKHSGVLKNIKTGAMTGGLVQEESLTVLPTPTPLVTFLITFASMLPMLIVLSKRNLAPKNFIKSIVIGGFSSFMFGWHVHEKAILTVIFPLCILAMENQKYSRQLMITSTAGLTSVLPLLYPAELVPIKIALSILWLLASFYILSGLFKPAPLLKLPEMCFISILPLITIYETVLHRLIFKDKMPFLPLMLTSIYCAIGLVYSYLYCYYDFVFDETDEVVKSGGKSKSAVSEETETRTKKGNEKKKKKD